MSDTIKITSNRRIGIVYVALAALVIAVFAQVAGYGFIIIDDPVYILSNAHIRSGMTLDGIIWAFTTPYADLWHPMVWLSLMADYRLFGLNAGGYHLTNIILHLGGVLLLFWLFNRMTRSAWRSAFVAAFFAVHPLHVESVAWISERKDVLSAFFWMLTLCLYVYYTEKPVLRRYLPVMFSFACALMSKPMAVTLPVIMILLDYWPLKRLPPDGKKLLLQQLREKLAFMLLSGMVVVITFYDLPVPDIKQYPLDLRLANAPVSFAAYLIKTFWPGNLIVFYPFPGHVPVWQWGGAVLFVLLASVAVVVKAKQRPCLLAGWLWYAITLLPVLKIIQIGSDAMADRYHYLPSIGISIMLAWGMPLLVKNSTMRKRILLPAAIVMIAMMALLAWQQTRYWKNSITLLHHAVDVKKDVYVLYESLGHAYYFNGDNRTALTQYDKALSLNPNYAPAYFHRANAFAGTGQDDKALQDYSTAVRLQPDYITAYYTRGIVYAGIGEYLAAIADYSKVIALDRNHVRAYNSRGIAYLKLDEPRKAIEDFDEAIRRNPDFGVAYNNRAYSYFTQGNHGPGCRDARKACALGDCELWTAVQREGRCRGDY